MKIYILTDLEGVGGVVDDAQLVPGSPRYEDARRWLTLEVNAAVEGALAGGATEVVVRDGHGANGGYNLLLDEAHEAAEYVMGGPQPVYLEELDAGFDGMFQVGAHAMAGTARAVLEHTQSPQAWEEMRVNGRPLGEMGFAAAIAGELGVPCVLVTGDQAVCDEARDLLGSEVEVAVTKVGFGRSCARVKPPAVVRRLIRERAQAAMGKLGKVPPLDLGRPVEIILRFKHTALADHLSHTDRRRLDARTIAVRGDTAREAFHNLF
jgi:D-amino peptidase